MKRPTLGKIASSLNTLVLMDAANALYRNKTARKSEADVLGADLRHARDFIVAMEPFARECTALLTGETLVPLSAVHGAARQIAEEGAE